LLILKYGAFFKAAFPEGFVIIQAMLAVPFLHRLDRPAVKARCLLHYALIFTVFSRRKEHSAHLPSKKA
jgi:hypothetical protein